MANSIQDILEASQDREEYDLQAKVILSIKLIIAWFVKDFVEEFKDVSISKIASMLETPYIVEVPLDPGSTNEAFYDKIYENLKEKGELKGDEKVFFEKFEEQEIKGLRISGLNTEDGIPNEGKVYFDIVTYLTDSFGSRRIILHLEIEKNNPGLETLRKRAIYYMARLISSQKYRDFMGTQYNKLVPIYSFWICLNKKKDRIEKGSRIWTEIYGKDEGKIKEETSDIFIIEVADEEDEHYRREKRFRILGLLRLLFSLKLSGQEKARLLSKEFGINLSLTERKELDELSLLADNIAAQGRAEGRAEGRVEGRAEEREELGKRIVQLHRAQGHSWKEIRFELTNIGFTSEEVDSLISV